MRKFYVYVHRRLTDNTIFYVGKGARHRATSRASRSEAWHKIASEHGFKAEICSALMPNDCALSFEKALISAIGFDRLCNIVRGGNHGMSGRKFDRNVVKMRSEKCMKPVINSDGVVFPSLKHAVHYLRNSGYPKATEAHISSCCKGDRHVAFGFSWSMNIRNVPPLIDASAKVNEFRKKKIIASNGKEFESVTMAAQWVNSVLNIKCGTSDISRCCKGSRKLCAGLQWKYAEE